MTVATTNNKKVYAGLTGQDTFAYDFRVDVKEDMKVYFDDVLQSDGDWTITNLGNPAGGNVVLNSTLAQDTTVVLLRNIEMTQNTDYQPNDPFPAETHEAALDKLTLLVQQLQEQLNRATLGSVSVDTQLVLGDPSQLDGSMAFWNNTLPGIDGATDIQYDNTGGVTPLITITDESGITTAALIRAILDNGNGIGFQAQLNQQGGNVLNGYTNTANRTAAMLYLQSDNVTDNDDYQPVNVVVAKTNRGRSSFADTGIDVGPSAVAIKSASTTRSNLTVLTDDPDLTFYAEPNSVYEVELMLRVYNGSVGVDMKMGWNIPGAAAFIFSGVKNINGAGGSAEWYNWSDSFGNVVDDSGNYSQTSGQLVLTLDTGTATQYFSFKGFVYTAATGGDVTLQWAQNVSSLNSVNVNIGSCLKAHRIGAHT